MANKCIIMFLATLVVYAVNLPETEADVLVGSCVWGAVDYKSDCEGYCASRGYSGGHCGSAFNVNCWCET